jgi:hypothetical protein
VVPGAGVPFGHPSRPVVGHQRISAFMFRTSLRAHLRTSCPGDQPASTRAPEHRLRLSDRDDLSGV